MELVYTVAKSQRHKRRDFVFRDERPLISLSARNSLALCTTAALAEDKAERYVNSFSISPFPRCIIIMCLSKHKYLFYAT